MIIEEKGYTKDGLPYLIAIMENLGTRNGYVGVYEDSILYKIGYDDPIHKDPYSSVAANVAVHGGLTYSGFLGQQILGAQNPYFFGFDCAHLGDSKISISEMQYLVDTFMISKSYSEKKQIINRYTQLYNLIPSDPEDIDRTLDYVREQCFQLSTQLIKIEKEE